MSLRPHSMTGGKWHSPIWTPYSIYARVDYVYGFPALERGDGWPMAQSALNVVETAMYIAYLFLVYKYGVSSAKKGRGAPAKSRVGWLAESREVKGELGGIAALLGFSVAVMTLSKTVIYCMPRKDMMDRMEKLTRLRGYRVLQRLGEHRP